MQFSSMRMRRVRWSVLEEVHQDLVRQVQAEPQKAHLLLSEPEPTFTYGRCASSAELLWSQEDLLRRRIEVHSVSRGGRWTYHGPGQLVVYPVVSLRALGGSSLGVRMFMNRFRQALVSPLQNEQSAIRPGDEPFGIFGTRGKLASFGVAVSRGVVHHGGALYVEPQGDYFSGIHPCGVAKASVSSLREEGISWDWEETARMIEQSLKNSFEMPLKGDTLA